MGFWQLAADGEWHCVVVYKINSIMQSSICRR